MVLGYESVAADLGRSVLILSTHGRAAAPAMVEEMALRCDGLVVMGRTVPDEVVERLAGRGVPLVLLARPQVPGIDSVKADNTASAGDLLRHVASLGAHRVTMVGDASQSPDVAERWAGVERAAVGTGVTLSRLPVPLFSETAGIEAATKVLSGGLPDALLCANDELALGLLGELTQRGVRVPDDVLVTGWDDIMAARYAGLTTVRQPMRSLGETAARLLDEVIAGSRSEPRHEVLPTELVVRASSSPSRKG